MADEERAKADGAAEKAASRDRPSEEVRHSVEELKENARGLLDVSPHAVAGAFAGTEQKTFTVEAAKKRVADFLKKPADAGADA